jgi:hypothetical protein
VRTVTSARPTGPPIGTWIGRNDAQGYPLTVGGTFYVGHISAGKQDLKPEGAKASSYDLFSHFSSRNFFTSSLKVSERSSWGRRAASLKRRGSERGL